MTSSFSSRSSYGLGGNVKELEQWHASDERGRKAAVYVFGLHVNVSMTQWDRGESHSGRMHMGRGCHMGVTWVHVTPYPV